ncbi:MAG: hypothetical protein R3F54_04260 [Alphaproteobacteria bacterium]
MAMQLATVIDQAAPDPTDAKVNDPRAVDAPRVAVVVVGAGRSGTSVLTAGVGALGVDLGDRLKPGGVKKNPKGFFEDVELLEVNHRVHKAFGLRASGANVRLVDDRAWQTVGLEALHDEAVAIIERRFDGDRPFGLKSGGLLRLMPFWERVFASAGVEPRYVMALRNPLGVADSRANLEVFRGYQEKSDLEWLAQVLPYIDRLEGHPLVVVDYDLLMRDPKAQLHRVAAGLDLPLGREVEAGIRAYAEGFATRDLYHHRHDPAALDEREELNPLTVGTYLWLHRLATDDIGPNDPELWSAIKDLQERFAAMAPVLRYVDFLEEELKRRYFGLAGLWQKLQPRIGVGGKRNASRAG